jgi:hypothetical protein
LGAAPGEHRCAKKRTPHNPQKLATKLIGEKRSKIRSRLAIDPLIFGDGLCERKALPDPLASSLSHRSTPATVPSKLVQAQSERFGIACSNHVARLRLHDKLVVGRGK